MARIAIIINSLFAIGGEERVVSIMANEFAKRHDVTIYTSETRRYDNEKKNNYYISDKINVEVVDPKADSFIDKCIKIVYRNVGFPSSIVFQKVLQKVFYPEDYLKLWIERINSEGYDIVISISGANTMLLGLIKEQIDSKCISWEHNSYDAYFSRRTSPYKSREKLFSYSARKLDKVIVLNEDYREKYKQRLNVDSMVIPNPKSFSSKIKANISERCIVSCGRLDKEKGFDDLIFAFDAFHKEKPDWKLKIIGGGRLENQLRKQIDRLGLSESILITGYTDKVAEELSRASIFVMTSRYEGFPMTITEALEMGLPVIAYGIPALNPLVTSGVEGLIVPPFDRKKLVDAMITLAQDVKMRNNMSKAAIEKAKTLTPEMVYEKWDELFEELL